METPLDPPLPCRTKLEFFMRILTTFSLAAVPQQGVAGSDVVPLLDDVNGQGMESNLFGCSHDGINQHNCSGVAGVIKNTEGAIGYLNYGYVNGGKFQQVALQNKAGNFVKANSETSAAGLSKIVLDDQLRGADANPAGENAYPIVSLTWILAYPESTPGVKETLRYMLSEKSQAVSDSLGYVPLPEDLRQKSLEAVESISE